MTVGPHALQGGGQLSPASLGIGHLIGERLQLLINGVDGLAQLLDPGLRGQQLVERGGRWRGPKGLELRGA
eukprot:4365429-Alexandrium_andersonii.AAC.1